MSASSCCGRPASEPSGEKVVSEDVEERSHPVAPGDLLSFHVRSSGVRYRDLEYSRVRVREARGDFRLEAETARFQCKRPREVSANSFVAALHVSHIQIAEHVAES